MDKPTLHSITKEGQKPNPAEPEEELDYYVEVSSAANVLRFFEEYFNAVGGSRPSMWCKFRHA